MAKYWGVVAGSCVGSNPVHNCSSGPDGTQCDVARCHLGHCSKVMLMHAVEVFDGGAVVVDELSVLEEMEISECKYFRASFFLLLNFDIFA